MAFFLDEDSEKTAIPIMAMFLEEDSVTTWNDNYTFLTAMFLEEDSETIWNHSIMACFLNRTVKLHEITTISIMAMFLEEKSETIWKGSYTYYGQVSWGEQRNHMKWQLYVLRPCFLRRTEKLPETTAIPIMAMFLKRTAKLHEMTAIPIKDMFLEEDTKTTWNDSYTCYGHVSWGG